MLNDMMMHVIEQIADLVDCFVVVLLVGGMIYAFGRAITMLVKKSKAPPIIIRNLRIGLGQVILLSLEILIVSDILHSIVHRTLQELGMLAMIVAIRFALSFMLEREIEHLRNEETR